MEYEKGTVNSNELGEMRRRNRELIWEVLQLIVNNESRIYLMKTIVLLRKKLFLPSDKSFWLNFQNYNYRKDLKSSLCQQTRKHFAWLHINNLYESILIWNLLSVIIVCFLSFKQFILVENFHFSLIFSHNHKRKKEKIPKNETR